MAKLDQTEIDKFYAAARKMYFSKEAIESWLQTVTPTQLSSVYALLSKELCLREESKKRRLLRKAKFPVMKALNDFDYSDVVFPDGYTKEDIESLEFVKHGQDFVFYGKTGRGKTHLAIALGIKGIECGMQVRYFSTASLVRQLSSAAKNDKLETLFKDIAKADMVILDEFGYIPLDIDGARLLFQVISDCYETRSMILTTNIEFSKWGTVFADDKLAAAAVDRIVHHGRLVEFRGSSRRMDESLMLCSGKHE